MAKRIIAISCILCIVVSLLCVTAFGVTSYDINYYIENWPTGSGSSSTVGFYNQSTGTTLTTADLQSLSMRFSGTGSRGVSSVYFDGTKTNNERFTYTFTASNLNASFIRGVVMEYNGSLYEIPYTLIGVDKSVNLYNTASWLQLTWPETIDNPNVKFYIITTESKYVFGSYKFPDVDERKFSLLAQPLQYDSTFSFSLYSSFSDVLFGVGPFTYGQTESRFVTNVGNNGTFTVNLSSYDGAKLNEWYRFVVRAVIYGEKDFPAAEVINNGLSNMTVKIRDQKGTEHYFKMGQLPFELTTDCIWDEKNQCYYFDFNVSVLLDTEKLPDEIEDVYQLDISVTHGKTLKFSTDENLYFELLNAYQGSFTPEAKNELEFYEEEQEYKEFETESDAKNDKAQDLIDQMGDMYKPDVDKVIPDTDNIISTEEVKEFSNTFSVVFEESHIIEEMMLLSLTVALGAYILFGKKK